MLNCSCVFKPVVDPNIYKISLLTAKLVASLPKESTEK